LKSSAALPKTLLDNQAPMDQVQLVDVKNILDNAIIACKHLPQPQRKIMLRTAVNGDYLSIKCTNSCQSFLTDKALTAIAGKYMYCYNGGQGEPISCMSNEWKADKLVRQTGEGYEKDMFGYHGGHNIVDLLDIMRAKTAY